MYTELSPADTKYLLQASIKSVKKHMATSRMFVLYHGDQDKDFQDWLQREGIVLHQHHPVWRSDLFQHTAKKVRLSSTENDDLFREWQRIDLPDHVESEYCLYLEPGTIVRRPFTLANFGLNLTWSAAFVSSEVHHESMGLSGISLLNIPRLRDSHSRFLEFVRHEFPDMNAGVRAAYSQFYKHTIQRLADDFAFQPHETRPRHQVAHTKATYFHDLKPGQYLRHLFGTASGSESDSLAEVASQNSYLCSSMQSFSVVLFSAGGSEAISGYCATSFPPGQANGQ